jgi:IMP dehydrogenase
MKTVLSFDDVLIVPKYSTIRSRKDVDTITSIAGHTLKTPIISSNMDTVTGHVMANSMAELGGIGCLHRFQSIEDNVKMYKASHPNTWGSFGVGDKELERLEALFNAGITTMVLDVAHGSSQHVVEAVKRANEIVGNNVSLVVGNFATAVAISDFEYYLGFQVDAYKIGIGGGSACSTRVVTGCGLPTFASLLDIKQLNRNIICDGGIRNSGDYSKALAVGAKAVMLGRLLSGTTESPGRIIEHYHGSENIPSVMSSNFKTDKFKNYRGSASAESYEVQGKTSEFRSAEGESMLVPYVGSVKGVIEQLQGGLRSSMSYTGSTNLNEFVENSEFIQVTSNGLKESLPHGKY